MAIAEIVKFARIPVLAAPSLSLAANRMVQNGRAVARSVKYANMSLMLNHRPYSNSVVVRAIIS